MTPSQRTRARALRSSGGPVERPTARRPGVDVDVASLEKKLARAVRGTVRFDAGYRALYATDGSNYRQVPIGVVVPLDVEDVVAAVAVCREHDAPVLPRGGGTSLAGQCCNVAVVIDCSQHLREIVEIDPVRRRARVQPGTVLDHLRNEAVAKYGLTFGPDPSTHAYCTFGGMIGNNSCGVHAQMAGRTSDNVEELEVLTYDGLRMRVGATPRVELERIVAEGGRRGEIYSNLRALRDRYAQLVRERYPQIPRRVSGYNLDDLLPERGFHVAKSLVGSEGTCVMVLEATVSLVQNPGARAVVILGYDTIYQAADHVPDVLHHAPIGLEALDDKLVKNEQIQGLHGDARKLLPEGGGWLLVEFGGADQKEADAKARALIRSVERSRRPPRAKMFDDPKHVQQLWNVREAGLGATALVKGKADTWEGWEDSAVPPDRLGEYLRKLEKLYEKYGYEDAALYGHFGQGCVHTRIPFDLESAPGIRKFRSFLEEATDLIVSLGGSFSGEHGDGQSRAEFLPKMFGAELVEAFREFKSIWDPRWRMNPGKVVDPYRVDENLRLGAAYAPPTPETHFRFPDDRFTFARAAKRCVGVGKCRKTEAGGVMCPSYMVTKDEMHSTRGRAHLLFEMLKGEVVEGWKSEPVKEALDLCLACKGCKGECPVSVDVATYKAEFLSHYYEGRLRPRAAYAMGLIPIWARLAKVAPPIANFVARAPGLSWLAKKAAGVHSARTLPTFAPETFRAWWARRGPRRRTGTRVLLWADTFNDNFSPAAAKAAAQVLELAGFDVEVPRAGLCCGRPFYDYGMLDRAKAYLSEILEELREDIRAGVPLVGIEPSCLVVFRDELGNLFPHDHDARRLREQSYTFAEFLEKRAKDWTPPRLRGKAVVQTHCHDKSIVKSEAERKLLEKMGLEVEVLDAGCCGMAGSFGFEADHYDVSQAVGERKLFPRLRETARDTFIVADGFSCQHQIEEGVKRKPLHLAEVIALAARLGSHGPGEGPPEERWRADARRAFDGRAGVLRSIAVAGLAAGALGLGAWALRSRSQTTD